MRDITQDASKVATMLGDSVSILRRYYVGVVQAGEAEN
jgi:hypothetical protein